VALCLSSLPFRVFGNRSAIDRTNLRSRGYRDRTDLTFVFPTLHDTSSFESVIDTVLSKCIINRDDLNSDITEYFRILFPYPDYIKCCKLLTPRLSTIGNAALIMKIHKYARESG